MPSSSPRGKSWIIDKVLDLAKTHNINEVWDIGAGKGTYSKLLRKNFPNSKWTAFEIWDPYVTKYNLKSKYDTVIVNDTRHIDFGVYPRADLTFAGDVIEHMTKEEAITLVDHVLTHSQYLVVSIPIIYYEQGPHEGNPYEIHVKPDWSDQEFRDTFKDIIVDGAVDQEIGVYLLSKDQELIKEYKKKSPLKIAIYTITKNESAFVDRWANSNTEADLRLVCDTGSTDDTVKKLRKQGVSVIPISVNPWRFDVARNTALNLLPRDIDICIWQDLDEALLPGWRTELEKIWEQDATIVNHRYRNNDNPWQWHSKIHARHNCIWTGAVHETLKWSVTEKSLWTSNIYLDEKQDVTKNRKGYMDLLEKKIREGDKEWRTFYFLSNDQQSQGLIKEAIETRIKSFELCDENDLVSRAYIAKNIAIGYYLLQEYNKTEKWFRISLDYGDEKETWFSMSEYYYNRKSWDQCYIAATKCLSITVKRDGYTQDPRAWGYFPYDYAAISAYNLGLKNKAIEYGNIACELAPDDERLKNNLKFYQEKT